MNSVIYKDVFMGVTDTPVFRDNVKELTTEIERLERLDDEFDQIESTDDQYKLQDSEIVNLFASIDADLANSDANLNGIASTAEEEACNQNVIVDRIQQSDMNYGNYMLRSNDVPALKESVEYSSTSLPIASTVTQPLLRQQDVFKGVTETPVMRENVRNLIAEVERLECLNEEFNKIVGIDDLYIVQDSEIGNIFDSIDVDLANSDANFNGIAGTAEQGCNQNVIVEQIQQSDMNYGDHMLRSNDVPTATETVEYSPNSQPIIQPLYHQHVIQRNNNESLKKFQEMEQQKALPAQQDAEILEILKELQSEDCTDEYIMANNSMPFQVLDSGPSNSERLPRKSVIDGDMLRECDPGDQSRIPILQQSQQDVLLAATDSPLIQDNVGDLIAEIERLGSLNLEFDQIEGVDDLLIHLNENDEELLNSLAREIDLDLDIAMYNILDVIDADIGNSNLNFNEITIPATITAEEESNENVIVDQLQQSNMNDGNDMLRSNDDSTSTESVEYCPISQPTIQPLVQQQFQLHQNPQLQEELNRFKVIQMNPHELMQTLREMEQQKGLQDLKATHDADVQEIYKQLLSEDCPDDFFLANNAVACGASGVSNTETLPTEPVIDGEMPAECDPHDPQKSEQKITQNTNKRKRKYATRNNTKKHDDNEERDKVMAIKIKKSNDKPFQCDICDKRFCTKSEIAKHIQVQHVNGHVEEVKKTNSIVTSEKSLKKREVNQSVEKPHVCNVCQKSFGYKCDLNRHLMIHNGDKPFKCDVCKKSFNRNSTLTVHLRIHNGEKPYTCKICNTSFRQKITLSEHLSIHTNEKPHICKVCNKAFRQHGNLSTHLKTHNVENQPKIRVKKH